MKKVLILSYYFPPCNLTAAQRIGSCHKYLPENGFYPIVVTRNWTGDELTEAQRLANSGLDLRIEKTENRAVHYLPYKSSWRDICFIKSEQNNFFRILSKLLTFWHIVFQNFTIYAIPYRNLYFHARQILQEQNDIEHLIISGNPFEQFLFGYLLRKEFPKLKWIADYRDDWTTTELIKKRSFVTQIIHKLERKSERKWLAKVDKISSVSQHYVNKISHFTNKEGFVLQNGYNEQLLILKPTNNKSDCFTLLYNGTLYPSQKIEVFLDGFKLFLDENSSQSKITIKFIGLAIDPSQVQRVQKLMNGYEEYLQISNRIPQDFVLEEQMNANLLLMFPHKDIKGIPSSKIYEYIGLKKKFVLCPTDNDVLDEIAHCSSLGAVCNSAHDVLHTLNTQFNLQSEDENIINESKIAKYAAKNQVKVLSNHLHET